MCTLKAVIKGCIPTRILMTWRFLSCFTTLSPPIWKPSWTVDRWWEDSIARPRRENAAILTVWSLGSRMGNRCLHSNVQRTLAKNAPFVGSIMNTRADLKLMKCILFLFVWFTEEKHTHAPNAHWSIVWRTNIINKWTHWLPIEPVWCCTWYRPPKRIIHPQSTSLAHKLWSCVTLVYLSESQGPQDLIPLYGSFSFNYSTRFISLLWLYNE